MSNMSALEREIAVRLVGEMSDEGFLDCAPRLSVPTAAAIPAVADADADGDDIEGPIGLAVGDDDDEDDGEQAPAKRRKATPAAAPEPVAEKVDPVQLVAEDLDVEPEWVEAVPKRMMHFDAVGWRAS